MLGYWPPKSPMKDEKAVGVILKKIVDFLNVNDRQAKELWDVLTALRGPDDADDEVKQATTAVIRHKLGLHNGVGGMNVNEDEAALVQLRGKMITPGAIPWHFLAHAHRAFIALGLSWDKDNSKKGENSAEKQ